MSNCELVYYMVYYMNAKIIYAKPGPPPRTR